MYIIIGKFLANNLIQIYIIEYNLINEINKLDNKQLSNIGTV